MALSPTPYARAHGYFIADATAKKDGLNAEVWQHERLAREQGLSLVVEVHSNSVLASRRLTEWWRAGGELAEETLNGIYLLRVDLKQFGPEAILRLTPYAIAGAPLFVGWNPVGQVLSRSQFARLIPSEMALPLSAFFADVVASRPHALNPHPSIGNVERNREAQALRQANMNLSRAPRSAAAPSARQVPEPVGEQAEHTGQAEHAAQDVTSALTLEQLLSAARAGFADLEDLLGQPLHFSLEDLRVLDLALDALRDEQRLDFARQLGAVVAVYLGDTIRSRVKADWQLEENSERPTTRLLLQGEVLGEQKEIRPMEWVIETLADRSRSLYGQALAWCRVH